MCLTVMITISSSLIQTPSTFQLYCNALVNNTWIAVITALLWPSHSPYRAVVSPQKMARTTSIAFNSLAVCTNICVQKS